jgi:hypothetical protein
MTGSSFFLHPKHSTRILLWDTPDTPSHCCQSKLLFAKNQEAIDSEAFEKKTPSASLRNTPYQQH